MFTNRCRFWQDAFTIHGSVTPLVTPNVFLFGLFAWCVCLVAEWVERSLGVQISLGVAPYEVAGAALGLVLILRTNAGYDRWWEARKLWGGIVNQSRNLAISALCYGPPDKNWQLKFIRWAAVFPHVARCSLRGQTAPVQATELLGPEAAAELANARHMPSHVVRQLGLLLREARASSQLDGFAFMQIDKERATLIDHIGACERILKTPLPSVYAIKIRRFIVLFLATLPFALLHKIESNYVIALLTMMVAYPLISLDQIGIELQNPFAKRNLGHLPIGEISANIEKDLQALIGSHSTEDLIVMADEECLQILEEAAKPNGSLHVSMPLKSYEHQV